ncbi:Armadillo-like helical [Penicillium brevicompactum]|uniref:Armadillo-like helical n=1 Tax=Penicillium brevicompactum TaxID=5074 RepID=UPI0025412EE6|nr:Armadillo-like helical [Penicillium brevicompactum]KAJ5319174.1 Armadillo-like helical [Penicillium brevicompactum]
MLVTELYNPANQRDPARIHEIQARLQQLQKTDHAWAIADSLLHTEHSSQHRFMGALTFTVKINVSWSEIDENGASEITQHLINRFVDLVNEGEQALVVRKLASSLVAILRHPATPMKQAVLQLAASLAHGEFVSEELVQGVDFEERILPRLNQHASGALLFFSIALAEEALRVDSEPQAGAGQTSALQRAILNMKDGLTFVQFILRNMMLIARTAGENVVSVDLAAEAMSSWKTWLGFHGIRQRSVTDEVNALAISCGKTVIETLRVPCLSESAASILTHAFETRRWVFDNSSLSLVAEVIADSIVTAHIVAVRNGDAGVESMSFVDLLIAYVSHLHLDIFTAPLSPQNEVVLQLIHGIFKTPGYASIDDLGTPRVLEFWNEVAESLLDDIEPDSPRYGLIKSHLAEVVLSLSSKLLYPTAEDLEDWSDEERSEFGAFRHEACDYLLSAYPILGVELVTVFQQSATSHLQSGDWRNFETAIFCIAQLSEAVDENGHADQCLDAIFGSDAFARLCAGGETGIPLKARQTLVDSFGKYESYFQRHSSLLPGVLSILFESLNFELCAQAASRSILTLSKSCARLLTSDLPAFLDQLDQFRSKPTATASTMPKVLEGIATIIQNLPTDGEKVQMLERILGFFVQEAKTACQEVTGPAHENGRLRGHLVLSCIASIGKGLRSDVETISVDDLPDEGPYPPVILELWSGRRVSASAHGSHEPSHSCDILRAGYTERAGLFVFPPSMTVDFIKSFPLGISGTDIIMATASSFLSSHASHVMQVRSEAEALIDHVARLFSSMMQNPDAYDPETANAGIDFLARLLPKYYPILFTPAGSTAESPLAVLLHFTLDAMTRPEPLPSEPQRHSDEVHQEFVPRLCYTIVQQIAGRCARSDLVFLNDALRRAIFKKMALARPALKAALEPLNAQVTDSTGQQIPLLSAQDKSRFVESLVIARGAQKPSLDIVRAFWLKFRGMDFDYAQ